MKIFTIHDAKTNLSKLIKEALSGEDVVIAKGQTPLVRLVVIDGAKAKRTTGTAKGKIRIAENFDAPLPEFESDDDDSRSA